MEFFKRKTHIDFLGIRKWTALLSIILVLASLASIMFKGINWGLDFTGGYQVQIQYIKTLPNLNLVRTQLNKEGIDHAEVVTFGSPHDLMIRTAPKKLMQRTVFTAGKMTNQDILKSMILKALGQNNIKITSVSYTGPQVGASLAQKGMLAMLIAVLATMLYIGLRFEMRFAVSSAVALAHDPIVIMGIFSFFQLRFDLTALAAVLAVIGYSLNDTVVIYDRVRENFRKMRKSGVVEVVNRAVNDTLSRTIMTSGLTLLVVVILFFFGGPSIHNFSLALIIGVVVGTYSSIYVAGALAVKMGLNRAAFLPNQKQTDGMP